MTETDDDDDDHDDNDACLYVKNLHVHARIDGVAFVLCGSFEFRSSSTSSAFLGALVSPPSVPGRYRPSRRGEAGQGRAGSCSSSRAPVARPIDELGGGVARRAPEEGLIRFISRGRLDWIGLDAACVRARVCC